jgi:hypothetical protein
MSDGGTNTGGAEQVRFSFKEPCDWSRGKRPRCNQTPTAYVGDIYCACEDHYDDFVEWLDRSVGTDNESSGGGSP